MNLQRIEAVASSVLYEGYLLYPYRPTALKNRSRFTFGGVFPRDWCAAHPECSDSPLMQIQCLVEGGPDALVCVRVNFLHLVMRQVGLPLEPLDHLPPDREPEYTPVPLVEVAGQTHHSWEEAEEMEIAVAPTALGELADTCVVLPVAIAGGRNLEPLLDDDGRIAAIQVRSRRSLRGNLQIGAEKLEEGLYRVDVRLTNHTQCDPELGFAAAQQQSFASSHAILSVQGGEFISLLEPPPDRVESAAECENVNAWPVLVGDPGERDAVLASPIILYDYPQVAPESPGDLFDATEIDEILSLRILAMTDAEKKEMAALDERARGLLMRTEALTAEDMLGLHGTLREVREGTPHAPVKHLHVAGIDLDVGAWVRLKPSGRADALDMMLAGRLAVIEAIERDFEDRVHVAVTLDDDPGRELGLARMPGHRFFFSPEEIVPVASESNTQGLS